MQQTSIMKLYYAGCSTLSQSIGNAPSLAIRLKMEVFPHAMPPVSPIR